jgi:SAM-dependent methyltransferase
MAPALALVNSEWLPWWLKMGAKMVLARVPISYRRWRALGVFQHGAMLDSDYAIEVFDRHYRRVEGSLPRGFSVLELGPGDSLATAVIAASRGASKVYLVDAGAFATGDDVRSYNVLAQRLAALGHPVPGSPYRTVAEMLAATRALYLTDGLRSLATIPEHSVDLVFSQAVLEHVVRGEFDATIRALYRLQKPGSLCSHRVDLQDHLAHSLNSLRFSRETWESPLLASSGFYTNRLRASQLLASFEAAGYDLHAYEAERWPSLPLPTSKMHQEFAVLAEDNLRVRGLDIVARRPQR